MKRLALALLIFLAVAQGARSAFFSQPPVEAAHADLTTQAASKNDVALTHATVSPTPSLGNETSTSASSAIKLNSALKSKLMSKTNDTAHVLSPEEEKEWRELLPQREKVVSDVKKNRHETSKHLTNLAPTFAAMIDEARASLPAAKKAFKKFEICAKDDQRSYVASLKATCLLNAKQLAKIYPDAFAAELQVLNNSVDRATEDLTKAYDSL